MRLLVISIGASYCDWEVLNNLYPNPFTFEAGIKETNYSLRTPSYTLRMVINKSL